MQLSLGLKKAAKMLNWSSNCPWVLMLILLNGIFFFDVIFTDKIFFLRDVANFHYPLKKLVTEAYARGEWPLWNPYFQMGQPLLANPNSMALYPTQVLFHLMPFEKAFNLHIVIHCALGGLATFFLARILRLSLQGAFFSAAIYNFCGVTLSFLNVFNILPVVTFLPGLSWAFCRFMERFTWLRLVGCVILLAFFLLLLEPTSTITVIIFLGTLLVCVLLRESATISSIVKKLILLSVVGLVALALSAVQILPTLELIRYSGRYGGVEFSSATYWSMHPANLVQMFLPQIFGDYLKLTSSTFWAQGFFENREPYLLSLYFGLLPLFFVILGVSQFRKCWHSRWLIGLVFLFFLLAMGKYTPLYSWLFHSIPIFRYGRYPVKYVLGAILSLSLLAGIGYDALTEIRSKNPKYLKKYLVGLAVLSGLGILGLLFPSNLQSLGSGVADWMGLQGSSSKSLISIPFPLFIQELKHATLILLLGGIAIFVLLWRQIHNWVVIFSFSALVLSDFFICNVTINPLTSADFYQTSPTALFINSLVEKEGLGRIYRSISVMEGKGNYRVLGKTDSLIWQSVFCKATLFQYLAAKDHIFYAVTDAVDRLETMPSQLINAELKELESLEDQLKFLEGLNVRYLISMEPMSCPLVSLIQAFDINSDKPLLIYRLPAALPRAFFTDAPQLKEDHFTFREYLSSQRATPAAKKETASPKNPAERIDAIVQPVRLLNYSPGRINLKAEPTSPGMLVILDSYFPGWRAFVNGKEVRVESINHVFCGIPLSRGKNEVIFEYVPSSFRWGQIISSSALGLLIFLICWRPRRYRA